MKKAFVFILLLTTLIVNSKNFGDHSLKVRIDNLAQRIFHINEYCKALNHLAVGVLSELPQVRINIELPLKPLEPLDTELLKSLPPENARELTEIISHEVNEHLELLKSSHLYIHHIAEQTDRTNTTNN